MTENALTVIPEAPAEIMRRSTDIAGICREIVTRTAKPIQGRKYVCVEGWEAIAATHGCVAGASNVERIEGGVRARGELRRISDGTLLATSEGFVGDDERTWANRPEYARRSMAQTRAISRVCRSAFAHVVVMIDADLATTPAEEMIEAEDTKPSPAKTQPAAPFDPAKAKTAALALLQTKAEAGCCAWDEQWKRLSEQQRQLFTAAEVVVFQKSAAKADEWLLKNCAASGEGILRDAWEEIPGWGKNLLKPYLDLLKKSIKQGAA